MDFLVLELNITYFKWMITTRGVASCFHVEPYFFPGKDISKTVKENFLFNQEGFYLRKAINPLEWREKKPINGKYKTKKQRLQIDEEIKK